MHHNEKRVHGVDLTKITSIEDLIEEYKGLKVFGGGQLGKALEILSKAYEENSTMMVGLAGAMIPGGMRKVIAQAIKDGFIHSLTTTGATITHDLIEAFGGKHLHSLKYESDIELREKGIDRVYDAFVAQGSFETFEDKIKPIFKEIIENSETDKPTIITPSELIQILGSKLSDPNSIVKAAYDANIPIFVPAISDSILGLQIWLFSQFNQLVIDSTKDLAKIQDIYHNRESSCAFLLGGGVPKNFTLQAALMASRHYKYAVQITMDRVETGGLSGASLQEAISWGKLEPDAELATVIADITIVLPIIFTALRQKFLNK